MNDVIATGVCLSTGFIIGKIIYHQNNNSHKKYNDLANVSTTVISVLLGSLVSLSMLFTYSIVLR